MIKTLMKKIRNVSGVFAVAAALAITISSVPAFAASPVSGSVSVIEYSSGTLLVQVAGVNYFGQLSTQSGCTTNNQSIDTIKAWQSLAQGALLSGKSVRVYFNTCGNTNYITFFDLNNV